MMAVDRAGRIAVARRLQPLDELERKERKARRRRPWTTAEAIDLSLARDWRRGLETAPGFRRTFSKTFCSLCSEFAPAPGELVQHKPRCSANPIDDGPYPGYHATLTPQS